MPTLANTSNRIPGSDVGHTVLVVSLVVTVLATIVVVLIYPIFHPPGGTLASVSPGRVSRDEAGLYDWPFTISSGIIGCTDGQAITLLAGGVLYGLNKPALDLNLPKPTRIIRHTPAGTLMPVTEILQRGLARC